MLHTDVLNKLTAQSRFTCSLIVCSNITWKGTMVATNSGPAPSAWFSTQRSQKLQSYMSSCDQCSTRPLSRPLGWDRSACTSHMIFYNLALRTARKQLNHPLHCAVLQVQRDQLSPVYRFELLSRLRQHASKRPSATPCLDCAHTIRKQISLAPADSQVCHRCAITCCCMGADVT